MHAHFLYIPRDGWSPKKREIRITRNYAFFNWNRCTTLVRNVDNRAGYACGKGGGMWLSLPFTQVDIHLKTTLRNEIF